MIGSRPIGANAVGATYTAPSTGVTELVFDATAANGGYPPSSISASHALGYASGNNRLVLLIASALGGATHTFSSVTYNGVTPTLICQYDCPLVFGRTTSVAIYMLLDASLPATAGSYTASFTTDNGYSGRLVVLSFAGAKQATPLYTGITAGTGSSLSGTVSSSHEACWSAGGIIDVFASESSTTTGNSSTPGSSQTELSDGYYNTCCIYSSMKEFSGGGGVFAMSQTPANAYWTYDYVLLGVADYSAVSCNVAKDNAAIIGAHF